MNTKTHTPKPNPVSNQKHDAASDGATCSRSGLFAVDMLKRAIIDDDAAEKFRRESKQTLLRDPETQAVVECYRHPDGRVLIAAIRLLENTTRPPAAPPEADNAAGAGSMARLVRPLPISGEADCPQCRAEKSVCRHNADWTCHKCGYHEIVDDDHECNHKYAAAGLNTGRCIKCDAVKFFETNAKRMHPHPQKQ